MRRRLDSQQTELVGRALLEAELVRQNFEVARPIRDKHIDLLVYTPVPFRAIPIQVKVKTSDGFDVNRKYEQYPGLILAYVWNIHDTPRFFLMTYDEALSVLGERAQNTPSWRKGSYNTSRPSREMRQRVEGLEDRWEWLRQRLS